MGTQHFSRPAPPAAAGEFLRYTIASGLALGVDVAALLFCTEWLGWHYLISAGIGFCLGLTVVYWCSIRWVFRHRRLANGRREFLLFLAIGLTSLAVNETALWAGTDLAGLPYQISKLLAVGVVFSFNFTVRKLLLFTPPHKEAFETND